MIAALDVVDNPFIWSDEFSLRLSRGAGIHHLDFLISCAVEDDLLAVEGDRKSPEEVYRKIVPVKVKALAKATVVE